MSIGFYYIYNIDINSSKASANTSDLLRNGLKLELG